MTKIDEIEINGKKVIFFDGIDFSFASEYIGDDYLVFLIDNWEDSLKKHDRDYKISKILGKSIKRYKEIDNKNVVIYQTSGYIKEVLDVVKDKFINNMYYGPISISKENI